MAWAQTGLPDEYLQSDIRRIALCDFITRVCAPLIRARHLDQNVSGGKSGWSGPKGGAFNINAPGQEILPRTSALINADEQIELRFTTSLPAAGRTILGAEAHQILAVNLVELVKQSLLLVNLDAQKLQQHVQCAENQRNLRQQLTANDLVAFVANGSILPRASGASATPMTNSNAVPFVSPDHLVLTLPLADGTSVTGMGVRRGITLLTGGGFHGKSTLLQALELGIYDHIPDDGRELVVTDPTAVKIRAEDGRTVTSLDITPYISTLPGDRDTKLFSTDDASGSTSMAANIQEALEVGCKALLIDEDSSATNLLVRDQRMQTLIKHEPITPLVAKARALHMEYGVSTVIVIGGLGDWLSVADEVIAMEDYVPRSITSEAKKVVIDFPTHVMQASEYGTITPRKFQVNLNGMRSPYATRKRFIAMKPQAREAVNDPAQDEPGVDLGGLDQIVEIGQARTIAYIMQQVAAMTASQPLHLNQIVSAMGNAVGIEHCLPSSVNDGELVAVRVSELTAALSRIRGIIVTQ
ncbi:hypothetical protein LTR86_002008 [Recurvomyces mirabilis]|nr:hypothetical protein LTR86_002008 [Recurvomyces mirabilis]